MSYGIAKYGSSFYGENSILDSELLKKYHFDLSKYVPLFIYNGDIFNRIYKAQEYQLAYLTMQTEDLLNQGFVDTATWSLSEWEEEYGITTNLNSSYEERREVIKAKKRGQGTCTKSLIRNVAEAFSGGECRVIENTAPYTFTIQFVGIKGIPKNMSGLKGAIDDIKPAHLVYYFKYTYTSWKYLDSRNLSWKNAEAITWGELEIYE